MKKVMSLSLTTANVNSMESPSLAKVVAGFGEFPDAIFDLTEIRFTLEGARLVVRAYRNADATEPLPLADPIVLDLTWDELRAAPGAPALEAAVRDAAWTLMRTHPKMNKGVLGGTHNIFEGGALIEV